MCLISEVWKLNCYRVSEIHNTVHTVKCQNPEYVVRFSDDSLLAQFQTVRYSDGILNLNVFVQISENNFCLKIERPKGPNRTKGWVFQHNCSVWVFLRPNFQKSEQFSSDFGHILFSLSLKSPNGTKYVLNPNVRFSDRFGWFIKAQTSEIRTCRNLNTQKFGFLAF